MDNKVYNNGKVYQNDTVFMRCKVGLQNGKGVEERRVGVEENKKNKKKLYVN
jgi:hypothetical protein